MRNEILKIDVNESMHVERAIRKFKRVCDVYGVTKEYRKRKEYKKPSIKSREKREAAEKRRNKLKRKSQQRKLRI